MTDGWVDERIAAEFPGLHVTYERSHCRAGRTPRAIRTRLAHLAGRVSGATMIAMRTQQIPRAYRTLYRELGLNPDLTPPPGEAAAFSRLRYGGFGDGEILTDALLLALVETGVPVWALDAERCELPLGITIVPERDDDGGPEAADAGAALPDRVRQPPSGGHWAAEPGTLALADAGGPLGSLFGPAARDRAPGKRTGEAVVYAVLAPGVPELHAQEALWIAREALQTVT